jgi:hypothetical protein
MALTTPEQYFSRKYCMLRFFRTQNTAKEDLPSLFSSYSNRLYTYYDDTVSLEPYYEGLPESSLVYVDPKKDPALVRDLVVLKEGPDKGQNGIVIGIYLDGSDTCAVKLDRFKGIREIRVVLRSWAAKRLGEQDPDDVFLIPRAG